MLYLSMVAEINLIRGKKSNCRIKMTIKILFIDAELFFPNFYEFVKEVFLDTFHVFSREHVESEFVLPKFIFFQKLI